MFKDNKNFYTTPQDKELVKSFDGNIENYKNNMMNNHKLLRIA